MSFVSLMNILISSVEEDKSTTREATQAEIKEYELEDTEDDIDKFMM